MSNHKTYFLFGRDICNVLNEGDIHDVARAIEQGVDYDLFVWIDDETDPVDLLSKYNGWEDFAVIGEGEYNLIKHLK